MLMHHSRNSEQKQWDETLVLALSGMGRLLRAHLPLLVPMQAFPQVWANFQAGSFHCLGSIEHARPNAERACSLDS